MTYRDATCTHCGDCFRRDMDDYDDEPSAYLCEDCATYAVLGGPCPDCGEIPGRKLCVNLETHLHYRATRTVAR